MVPKVSNEKYGPRFGSLGDLFRGMEIFYPVFFVGGFPFDILAKIFGIVPCTLFFTTKPPCQFLDTKNVWTLRSCILNASMAFLFGMVNSPDCFNSNADVESRDLQFFLGIKFRHRLEIAFFIPVGSPTFSQDSSGSFHPGIFTGIPSQRGVIFLSKKMWGDSKKQQISLGF